MLSKPRPRRAEPIRAIEAGSGEGDVGPKAFEVAVAPSIAENKPVVKLVALVSTINTEL